MAGRTVGQTQAPVASLGAPPPSLSPVPQTAGQECGTGVQNSRGHQRPISMVPIMAPSCRGSSRDRAQGLSLCHCVTVVVSKCS